MAIALALTALTVIGSILSGALALLHYEQDPGEWDHKKSVVDTGLAAPGPLHGAVPEEGYYRQEAVVAPDLSRERGRKNINPYF
ncbi:hypothetical protein GCM10023188_19410 [Pontibacter saemangeumensis]|uniref:FixH protein n=1 Tax=Pontibacter saemangeumensis TaxID=1084525 RepID=A0ABP8LKV7_9BACT